MSSLTPQATRSEDARERALAAAVRRFSTQAYDQVGLRHIAADAGLDVARVHRLFGSKEQLFAESVQKAFGNWPSDISGPQALARTLTARLLAAADRAEGDPLLLLVRSVSDPHAAPILRARIEDSFLKPAAEIAGQAGSPGTADRSAALLAACCLGIAVMRDVLGVSALAGAADAGLAARIERLLGDCLSDVPSDPVDVAALPAPVPAAVEAEAQA